MTLEPWAKAQAEGLIGPLGDRWLHVQAVANEARRVAVLLPAQDADPRLGRTSFGEWADRWLASTVNLRANTKAGYRTILRQYLRPAFGSFPLARIDVLAVRTWLARLEAEGVGQATRAKAYRLLARILGAAVEARYLAMNPCSIRGAASDGTAEMRIATVEQVAAIADQLPPRYRAMVLVAALVGCAGASWPGCAASAST
jgi:Phage integrase, N-terminal SAM-like domain